MARRCIHRRRGSCPSCRAFAESVAAYVAVAKKGDRPWTRTFGDLSRAAGKGR